MAIALAALAARAGASPAPESCPLHDQHAAGNAHPMPTSGNAAPTAAPVSAYLGQEAREIKALSADEVTGYLEGRGMGLARTAELNHYPGPRHVLELADDLELTAEQRRQTEALFATMKADAVPLGRRLVELEGALEERFASGAIDEPELRRAVAEIAGTQGDLRVVHLKAHLAQWEVLSAEQRAGYDRLRGYGAAGAGAHPGH
jgi:Spy/CpxP family protein refolding chaperone